MYYILCIKVSLFHELVITNKFYFVVDDLENVFYSIQSLQDRKFHH